MKSGKPVRRTHIRRGPGRPDIAVYDLTRLAKSEGCAVADDADAILRMPAAFRTPEDIFAWCAAILSHSPTALSLWRGATGDGWSLASGDLKGGGFCLDIERRQIILDHFALSPSALGRSAFFRNSLLYALLRALRDVWHESAGHGAAGVRYAPEDTLMAERVRAADCETVALLAGWELRGAGFSEVWRHAIGAAEGDMAMVFTRHLERDPSALFDGSALAYAFRQWHADENRPDSIDHATLESIDGMAAEDAPFGTARLETATIEEMSELPGGIRYLQGLGRTVRNDPFFAGLSDPINQTHLFHLVYDSQVMMVNNVPFRDQRLARLIFPDGETAARAPC